MDKKNTMLLTVIAVATLLVAVVGATFAYFSVDTTGTSATTSVTTSAESVGSVSMLSANNTFTLKVTAAQMSEVNKTKIYYATTDGTTATETGPTNTAVANINATGVADANVTYKCTFNVSVKTTGDEAAMAVLASDSNLTLVAGTGVTLTNNTFNLGTASASTTGEVTIADGESTTISAYASLTNKSTPQDDLAGASGIQTTVTFDTFKCDTIANS